MEVGRGKNWGCSTKGRQYLHEGHWFQENYKLRIHIIRAIESHVSVLNDGNFIYRISILCTANNYARRYARIGTSLIFRSISALSRSCSSEDVEIFRIYAV
jgi:hypothetical protein